MVKILKCDFQLAAIEIYLVSNGMVNYATRQFQLLNLGIKSLKMKNKLLKSELANVSSR